MGRCDCLGDILNLLQVVLFKFLVNVYRYSIPMKRLGMAKKFRDFRGVQRLADRVCVAKQFVGILRQTVGV